MSSRGYDRSELEMLRRTLSDALEVCSDATTGADDLVVSALAVKLAALMPALDEAIREANAAIRGAS